MIPEGAARSRRGRPVAEVPIGEACLFDEAVGHIDSEAIHAPVEPETEHTIKQAPDFGVFPVEIGLALIKNVEIPLARGSIGVRNSGPCGAAEDGLPVVGGKLTVVATTLPEHVALALG